VTRIQRSLAAVRVALILVGQFLFFWLPDNRQSRRTATGRDEPVDDGSVGGSTRPTAVSGHYEMIALKRPIASREPPARGRLRYQFNASHFLDIFITLCSGDYSENEHYQFYKGGYDTGSSD